jgi:hypothetical protein
MRERRISQLLFDGDSPKMFKKTACLKKTANLYCIGFYALCIPIKNSPQVKRVDLQASN